MEQVREQVSVQEPVSTPAEAAPIVEQVATKTEQPAQPQPLTEEAIRRIVAEAAVAATEEGRIRGRRELQSEQDRNRAELARAQRRAQISDDTLGAVRSHIQKIDPEIAKELELAELRAERAKRAEGEQEDAATIQQKEVSDALHEGLIANVTELGIDPKDKRIDWAEDATTYVQGRRRFDASLAKIVKESRTAAESGWEKRFKDLEKKVNAQTAEVNSVSTASSGAVSSSDVEFVKNFAADKVPLTKANIERYNKIREKYD